MNKGAKIAIIAAAVVAVGAAVLFCVIPMASSKEAEARLGEVFADAGVPDEMWSISKAYYYPLSKNLVIKDLEVGEPGGDVSLEAKKVVAHLAKDTEAIFEGSVNASEFSFAADDTGFTAKSLAVNGFSLDKALFEYSPSEALKKLENIRLTEAAFRERGRERFSLGALFVDVNYVEGRMPASSSLSAKDFAVDFRQVMPSLARLPAIRPEYRISSLELKNSFKDGVNAVQLSADGADLFTVKADFGLSLPPELIESGELSDFARIRYSEDAELESFSLVYTDKSFFEHMFELAGRAGGREAAAKSFNETLRMIAMMGGVQDMERFADEAAAFIANPEKFELKMNNDSPVSLRSVNRNPLAMKPSLSINGGEPFTAGGR